MPKVTFEFDLPEDQTEYEVASQANQMQSFLWDYSQQLRAWYNFHTFKDANDAVDKIRKEFYRLLNDNQVNIDL
jgi:ribosomal protein L31E